MGLLSTFSLILLIGAAGAALMYGFGTETHTYDTDISELDIGPNAKSRCLEKYDAAVEKLKEDHTIIDRSIKFGPCSYGGVCRCLIQIKTI